MTSTATDSLVVFKLDDHEFAVELSAVERVVRAVEIEPLPDAPAGVRGVINLQGSILPVFDIWHSIGLKPRELRTTDQFVIAHTRWRRVALIVESVVGVVPRADVDVTPASEIHPDLASISGVMKLGGNLVLVHDLDRFLSIEAHETLQLPLNL